MIVLLISTCHYIIILRLYKSKSFTIIRINNYSILVYWAEEIKKWKLIILTFMNIINEEFCLFIIQLLRFQILFKKLLSWKTWRVQKFWILFLVLEVIQNCWFKRRWLTNDRKVFICTKIIKVENSLNLRKNTKWIIKWVWWTLQIFPFVLLSIKIHI